MALTNTFQLTPAQQSALSVYGAQVNAAHMAFARAMESAGADLGDTVNLSLTVLLNEIATDLGTLESLDLVTRARWMETMQRALVVAVEHSHANVRRRAS